MVAIPLFTWTCVCTPSMVNVTVPSGIPEQELSGGDVGLGATWPLAKAGIPGRPRGGDSRGVRRDLCWPGGCRYSSTLKPVLP